MYACVCPHACIYLQWGLCVILGLWICLPVAAMHAFVFPCVGLWCACMPGCRLSHGMPMHTHTHSCIHTGIHKHSQNMHTRIHVRIHDRTQPYTQACTQGNECTYITTYTHAQMNACISTDDMHAYTYKYTYTHVRAIRHAMTHTCMRCHIIHTCINAGTHTQANKHTQTY